MTRSPGENGLTARPTAATAPEASWPKMRRAECEPVAIFFRSGPQIPQVWTRMKSSSSPIYATGTVAVSRTGEAARHGGEQAGVNSCGKILESKGLGNGHSRDWVSPCLPLIYL